MSNARVTLLLVLFTLVACVGLSIYFDSLRPLLAFLITPIILIFIAGLFSAIFSSYNKENNIYIISEERFRKEKEKNETLH